MLSINDTDIGEESLDDALLTPPLPPRDEPVKLNKSIPSLMLDSVSVNSEPTDYSEVSSPRDGDDVVGGGSDSDLDKLYENESGVYRKNSYLWMFPVWMEKRLQRLDDPLIKYCQQLRGKTMYYICLLCTGAVAIELGIAAPFVLFVLGFDTLATEFTCLALVLALVSQIPKRFVWRFRPYMVNRAQLVKKDTTSSFPSRAVTCATVYSFAIIWGYVYKVMGTDGGSVPFRWWMPTLFVLSVLLSSFARINLGVHYPSDCIAGLVQGLLICGIGTAFWKADVWECPSCRQGQCYSSDPDKIIGFHSLGHINFVMMIVVILVCFVVPVISVMKPIDFWSKCDRVYGILFPGITFQLLFLCPLKSSGSLPMPRSGVEWYDVIFACGLAGLGTGLCMKIKGRHPFIVYFVLYTCLLVALVLWRLADL